MASRPLGIGLLAGGVGLVVLMLAWLAVSGAHGGGIVLGLILLFVLAGPLLGSGAYILSRQPAEARQAAEFASRRRVIDSDRVFRTEIATSLRSLAGGNPVLPAALLGTLADELQSPSHTTAEWQSSVALDDSQLELLGRYDDLVRERVRRLRDDPTDAQAAVRELSQAIDQREDLLLRGRAAPSLDPSVLLRTDAPRQVDLEAIGVGDAVSRDRTDYVVESVASYFAEGQRWKLARLVPSGAEGVPRWLYVGPGGLDVALLDEVSPAETEAAAKGGSSTSGTAVVDVTSRSGTARGVLVTYARSRSGAGLSLVEHWPQDVSHAYAGALLRPGDLEVWPSQAALQPHNAPLSNA